jgi:hypothetical protein
MNLPNGSGFAVVELFTSEGCSSCPPADELLAKQVVQARQNDLRVFPIAHHVDYWDRLGWRDPFSSAEASARQQRYAQAFKSEQIYTPQIIVNGETEFVGSDARMAQKTIAAALAATTPTKLSLKPDRSDSQAISVEYAIESNQQGMVLNLVLVERGLTTQVLRGENGGRTLTHENVARVFQTIDATDKSGHMKLSIPPELNVDLSHASVIGFLQNPRTMQILAADGFDLGK